MKITDEEWKKALEEHLTPEMMEAAIQDLLASAMTMLPEEMKGPAQTDGNYLHHMLRACALMIFKVQFATTREIMEQLENYQEKPGVLRDRMQKLLARIQKPRSETEES